MSTTTDLQPHHELPRLQIAVAEPSIQEDGGGTAEPEQPNTVEDDESCRTPTSEESKIPAILTCPPAPRRKPSLKRKSPEPGDKVKKVVIKVLRKDDEELEALFRSIVPPSPGEKRSRICRCST